MTGIIFDADGVLLDSMPMWMQAGEKYLTAKKIQPEEGIGEKLFSMSMEEGAHYIKKTYHLLESIPTICDEINQVVLDAYTNSIPLKPGVLDTLKRLHERNIPMVIATSSDLNVMERALKRLSVAGYFQKIFTCSEVGVGKNKPDIYLAAAAYLGTIAPMTKGNYREIYVVEDSLPALLTAKRAGFTVMGIYDEASKDTWERLCVEADIASKELKEELF